MTIKEDTEKYKLIDTLSEFIIEKIHPNHKETVRKELHKIIELLQIKDGLLSSKDKLIRMLMMNNAVLLTQTKCK